MDKQEFQNLLERYFNGSASKSEKHLVEKFYSKHQDNEAGWESFDDSNKEKLRVQIFEAIQKKKSASAVYNKQGKGKLSLIYKVAASILIAVGLSALYFSNQQSPVVAPKVNYITKSTKVGQKATITLSDGSTVRLNSESSITFPDHFAADLRVINLKGEAFFEVERDEQRPFIVSAHDLQTTVLGTSFNINAYDSSAVAVSLISGRVKVNSSQKQNSSSDFNNEVFLTSGESALFRRESNTITTQAFDAVKITAWKDGIIYFSDAGHDQIFNQLARWYGVEFSVANKPVEQWSYSGEFKDMSLETVLNTIAFSEPFEFKILGEEVKIEFKN